MRAHPFDADPEEDEDARTENKRAAMDLARRQACAGDPICGSFFAMMDGLRGDPHAAFILDTYDVDYEDDSDEERPY